MTLAVGLKLQAALEARGVKVVMTRTAQDVDISNSQRAQIGQQGAADLDHPAALQRLGRPLGRTACSPSIPRSIKGLDR